MGSNQGWDIHRDMRLVGDFNGDGMDDILAIKRSTTYSPYQNENGVFELLNHPTKSIIQDAIRSYALVGNIFRDQKDELVVIGFFEEKDTTVHGIYVQEYQGPYTAAFSFTITDDFSPNTGWNPEKHPVKMGDVNGDGHDDLIGFGEQNIYVALSNDKQEFEPKKIALKEDKKNLCFDQGWRIEKHHRLVGDINNDGYADILAFGSSEIFVYLGNKEGQFSQTNKVSFIGLSQPPFTFQEGWIPDQQPINLADIDGDGFLDIIGYTVKGVVVSYNHTKEKSNNILFDQPAFVLPNFSRSRGWIASRHLRTSGDIDGDGRAELIGFGANDVFIIHNSIFPLKGQRK